MIREAYRGIRKKDAAPPGISYVFLDLLTLLLSLVSGLFCPYAFLPSCFFIILLLFSLPGRFFCFDFK